MYMPDIFKKSKFTWVSQMFCNILVVREAFAHAVTVRKNTELWDAELT